MKVVHFSASLNRSSGGLPHSAAGLAAAQKRAGADVEVHGRMAGFDDIERQIWGDTKLVVQPSSREVTYALDVQLLRGVLAARPDILHIHGIWSGSTITGLVGQFNRITTVVAPHGMLEPYILARSPIRKAVHSFLFEKPLMRRAAIHALSAKEEESIRGFMGPEKVRIFTVPNGVELTPAIPHPSRTGALYLGRLHEKKQAVELAQFWRASPALQNLPLTIAGFGEPDYVRRVQMAVEGAENVQFIGPVYGAEKQQLFSQSRFFLLPSLSEGMPMAVLEAIAAGCVPVITPECNMHFLMSPSAAVSMKADYSNFAAVADQLLSMSPAEWARRSSAVQGIANDYGWERIADQMLSHYAQLLRDR